MFLAVAHDPACSACGRRGPIGRLSAGSRMEGQMRLSLPQVLLGAMLGVLSALAVGRVTSPTLAVAQTSGGVFGGYSLYPSPRKDTDKNESFIFVNQETGDIWIYMDANPREHYRFKKIGEPLEKVKD